MEQKVEVQKVEVRYLEPHSCSDSASFRRRGNWERFLGRCLKFNDKPLEKEKEKLFIAHHKSNYRSAKHKLIWIFSLCAIL